MSTFSSEKINQGAIASQPNLPPEFLEFWAKHEGTFPGLANGSQIEELCKEIALLAWLASQKLGVENLEDSTKLSRKFPR